MKYKDRLKEVERILQSGEKYNLEFLATYLLESEDVEKDKKQQYNFYTDEETFRKHQNKNVRSEILDFLENKAFNRKHIIPKKQVIKFKDFENKVIRAYEQFIQISNNIKLNKEVKVDQILSKDKLNGTIYFKHVEVGSTETDYFLFDFTDKDQILALLKCKNIDLSEVLACLVYDLNNLLKRIELTERQKQILNLWTEDHLITQEEIADILGIDNTTVNKYLDLIVKKIIKEYQHINYYRVYLNYYKGKYKKCSKCGEVKLGIDFAKEKRNNDGFKNICKECDNLRKM